MVHYILKRKAQYWAFRSAPLGDMSSEPLSRGQSPHPVLYVLNSTKTVLLFSSFVGRIRKFLIKKLKKDIKIGL